MYQEIITLNRYCFLWIGFTLLLTGIILRLFFNNRAFLVSGIGVAFIALGSV